LQPSRSKKLEAAVTGNRNILAMPESTIVMGKRESDAPLARARWRRAATKAVGALMTLAGIVRLIWHALH
jgi:hypothetical protein